MNKKYLRKKFIKRKFHKSKLNRFKHKTKFHKKRTKFNIIIKYLFFIFFLSFIILSITFNNENILYATDFNITSDKWIVMTVSNPPTETIKNLEKKIKQWKIVVICNNVTIESNWDLFKSSNNLIFLPIIAQNKLGYNLLKYLNYNSYCRKNIGYLFAIQHGAKEIYEIDENLEFSPDNLSFLDINVNDSFISYGKENNPKMINPYIHFGESNIWPRGFIIRDISSEHNKTFHYTHFSKIKLKPLVYQGLINNIPDADSLFLLTNVKKNKNLDISFSNNCPLLYLPGNYIPINSKNTKYLYKIFPFLMLPVTINESIADILRGYIIERFAFKYKGTIAFHNTNLYNNKVVNNSKLLEEKEIYLYSNKILEIIKSNKNTRKNFKKLLFEIINELIFSCFNFYIF